MAKTFNKGKTASSDKKDSPKSDDKLIDELAALEWLAYEKRRRGAAKELGVRATELDKFVRAEHKAVRRAKAAPAAMPDLAASATPVQKAAASALMRGADILEALGKAVEGSGLVGEADNAKILYLALTSRLFERPVSIAIKGVSAGGKSYTVETVLKFFPNAAYFARTGMSEKALIYSEESFKHRFIILYEAAGMSSDTMSYLIRTLLSEGRIDYELVDKTASDGLLPKHIVKEGPIGLITTTTQARLHPENETRLLSLSVVDTKEQTKAVMKSLAADRADLVDYVPWHLLQMRLAEGERRVEVPFAGQLADLIPPVAVRLRRDFKLLLTPALQRRRRPRATRARNPGSCPLVCRPGCRPCPRGRRDRARPQGTGRRPPGGPARALPARVRRDRVHARYVRRVQGVRRPRKNPITSGKKSEPVSDDRPPARGVSYPIWVTPFGL
jgi:hypothetical protein